MCFSLTRWNIPSENGEIPRDIYQNFFNHADSVRVLFLEVPWHDSVGARLP